MVEPIFLLSGIFLPFWIALVGRRGAVAYKNFCIISEKEESHWG
jgi:hypothetical protein